LAHQLSNKSNSINTGKYVIPALIRTTEPQNLEAQIEALKKWPQSDALVISPAGLTVKPNNFVINKERKSSFWNKVIVKLKTILKRYP
jgi:hypothetical protein